MRPKIENVINQKTKKLNELDHFETIKRNCIYWDALGAVMTSFYIDCKPPTFYLKLFEVYRSGHFPCGWKGGWPQGDLLVF
jgi:hypothetical protein